MRFIKNVGYLALMVISLVALNVPTLMLIFSNLSELAGIMEIVRYLVTTILIFLIYRFWSNKINLFVLPISFIPLPFFLYFVTMNIWDRGLVQISNVDDWGFYAYGIAFTYSLPFCIVTFIVSLVLEIRKRRLKKAE